MTYLGQSGLGFQAGPGFPLAGIEASESCRLSTVGKPAGVGIEGEQNGGGSLTEAGDALQQVALGLQLGVRVDVSNIPENIEIDIVIPMNEAIVQTDHFWPGDCGIMFSA